MKVLSANAVTKGDLTNIDKKQTEQIDKLRKVLAVAFSLNFAFTVAVLSFVLYKL